jgi:hypothetical protein
MSLYILSMLNVGKVNEAKDASKILIKYQNEEGLVYGPEEN